MRFSLSHLLNSVQVLIHVWTQFCSKLVSKSKAFEGATAVSMLVNYHICEILEVLIVVDDVRSPRLAAKARMGLLTSSPTRLEMVWLALQEFAAARLSDETTVSDSDFAADRDHARPAFDGHALEWIVIHVHCLSFY